MTNLERRITEWQLETFGGVHLPATFSKLCEEVGELGAALMNHQDNIEEVSLEVADIGILLNAILQGICPQMSLTDCMSDKMDIIENRSMERRLRGQVLCQH